MSLNKQYTLSQRHIYCANREGHLTTGKDESVINSEPRPTFNIFQHNPLKHMEGSKWIERTFFYVIFAAGLKYSSIVGNNQNFLTRLHKWLKPVTHQSSYWNRCYQATVNGWSSYTFHSNCDGKGPTVTIIRVGKYIFGGYTSLSWRSSCSSYLYDSAAFLFSLVNKPGWQPLKLDQTGSHSIYSCSSYGPTFGAGHDIHIHNNAASNTNSYSNLGHTYSPPSGYSYGSSSSVSFLAGSNKFRPDEVEVFYETT